MTGLLIVDDEEGVRRSLRKVLERDGYLIYQAENGMEAVCVVSNHMDSIEVVISDFKMPGMDGLETLNEIEKINPEITRIILTGYATMESAIESVNAGIDGFLVKPFENAELRLKVRECNIRKRLKQFVSQQVLSAMHMDGMSIAPRNRRVSILFSDIRGFSELSEKMGPREISHFLNSFYFTPLDNIIFEFDGTLDKHIGDGIMGIFGAPVSYGNDAARAVMCAVKMREEIAGINRRLADGGTGISIGIGISTGEGMVGVFGSNRKKEYTVFGRAVNLASRLERLAGGGQILICEETFRETVHVVEVEKISRAHIRGIDRRMDIYNVIGRKDPLAVS
ncbi:MAG: response regulator [Syntrophales bacterium]